jgi:hypothetical protein
VISTMTCRPASARIRGSSGSSWRTSAERLTLSAIVGASDRAAWSAATIVARCRAGPSPRDAPRRLERGDDRRALQGGPESQRRRLRELEVGTDAAAEAGQRLDRDELAGV